MDTITLKNWTPLTKYSGVRYYWSNTDDLNVASMHFKKQHQYLKLLLKDLAINYKPKGKNTLIVVVIIYLKNFLEAFLSRKF